MIEYIRAIADLLMSIATLIGAIIALDKLRHKKKKTQPKHKKGNVVRGGGCSPHTPLL